MNKLFIISGPSCAGEDSVIEGLEKYFDIERVTTTTTRPMRKGEHQGNPYYFISKEKFEEKIKKSEMLEYAKEHNDEYYGVTKEEIEKAKKSDKITIWKIGCKGVKTIKKIMPEIPAILINAPNIKTLEKRLRKRNPEASEEYIKERLKNTKGWSEIKNIFDYEVINEDGKLDETIKKVAKIIKKES